jgi:lysophospholipase L1-like esterase
MFSLVLLGAFWATADAQTAYDSLYLKSSTYRNLTGQHAMSQLRSADIVMFGNSITYGGLWNDLLGRESVVNRGIGGDNTVGMLHRLPSVYRLSPKICFIMAGINDLYADAPVSTIYTNYTHIIDTLRAHGIVPVIQSTLFVNPKWKRSEEKNPQVAELNRMLERFARENGIEWIDLNGVLSASGLLRDEYTTDGVHLTAAAYLEWRKLLLPILQQHGL